MDAVAEKSVLRLGERASERCRHAARRDRPRRARSSPRRDLLRRLEALVAAEAADLGDQFLRVLDAAQRHRRRRHAAGGRPVCDHHRLATGEHLPQRLGDERDHRVQHPQQLRRARCRARPWCAAADFVFARELHLGQFEVPVADLVPREVVQRLAGLGELVRLERRVDLGAHLVQTVEDPPVGVGEVAARRQLADAAPFISANLVALNSLVAKLRDDCA